MSEAADQVARASGSAANRVVGDRFGRELPGVARQDNSIEGSGSPDDCGAVRCRADVVALDDVVLIGDRNCGGGSVADLDFADREPTNEVPGVRGGATDCIPSGSVEQVDAVLRAPPSVMVLSRFVPM